MYPTGVTRLAPDLAPVWWTSSSGVPSNTPPTRPSLARNSSITLALNSVGVVDMGLLLLMGRHHVKHPSARKLIALAVEMVEELERDRPRARVTRPQAGTCASSRQWSRPVCRRWPSVTLR